ncbi:MAG: hypothetical protein ACI81P_003707 [Neolewinella sp.]|jgi:hypothetical protein
MAKGQKGKRVFMKMVFKFKMKIRLLLHNYKLSNK